MALLSFEEATRMAKGSSVEIYIITIQLNAPDFTVYQLDYQGWSDPNDEEFLYIKYSGNLLEPTIEAAVLPETLVQHEIKDQLFFSPTFPVCTNVLKDYLAATGLCSKAEEEELAEKLKQKIDHISGIGD